MKLHKLLVLTLALSCFTGSQQARAAGVSVSVSTSGIGKFATRTILLSLPFLVRRFVDKKIIKINKYGKDILTGAVAALCWPEAFR